MLILGALSGARYHDHGAELGFAMTRGKVRSLIGLFGRLFGDRRGSVSVDFVVSIPILLAVLVFTTEYGRVLQMRTTLDGAVSDATRYLARAPLNAEGTGYSDAVIAVAEQLITSRINTTRINIGTPVIADLTDQTASADYRTVSLSAAVGVATPALAVIALIGPGGEVEDERGQRVTLTDLEGLVLVSSDTARYFGR